MMPMTAKNTFYTVLKHKILIIFCIVNIVLILQIHEIVLLFFLFLYKVNINILAMQLHMNIETVIALTVCVRNHILDIT